MLMDLFVSTSSKNYGEAGKGWTTLTLVSFGCNFTLKGRTLSWREVDSLLQKVCGGKKSSCSSRRSRIFFCWRGAVGKIHSSLVNTGDGKSVGFTVSCPWTVFFSKMIKFTFKFYKVVNYSGNTLLQVENVIFTRLGFVFLEAPRF